MTFLRRKPLVSHKRRAIIWWRFSALMLLWLLLGVGWQVIRLTSDQIDRPTFGALVISSAAYLLATTALLTPLTTLKHERSKTV